MRLDLRIRGVWVVCPVVSLLPQNRQKVPIETPFYGVLMVTWVDLIAVAYFHGHGQRSRRSY